MPSSYLFDYRLVNAVGQSYPHAQRVARELARDIFNARLWSAERPLLIWFPQTIHMMLYREQSIDLHDLEIVNDKRGTSVSLPEETMSNLDPFSPQRRQRRRFKREHIRIYISGTPKDWYYEVKTKAAPDFTLRLHASDNVATIQDALADVQYCLTDLTCNGAIE